MKDNTTLAYERRIAANAEKAKRLAAEAKALHKESQKLKRNARTHHLCNLGAMLETFLKEPDILEEDDVQQFLSQVFSDYRIQAMLNRLLEEKRQSPTAPDNSISEDGYDETYETEIT